MSKNDQTRRAIIDFAVGGTPASFIEASKAHVVVAVDASDELDKLPDLQHVIKVPLGNQDTVISLLERLKPDCPEVEELLNEKKTVPNVLLSSGMAQDPRLGMYAVIDLALRGELDKIFEDILNRALEVTGGELEIIELHELNSNAGGMGGGGAQEIGERFSNYVLTYSGANISHLMLRLGGLTYTTVTRLGRVNTGNVTLNNLNAQLSRGDARRTYGLELFELPLRSKSGLLLRDNRDLRAMLAGSWFQARFANRVVDLVNAFEVTNDGHAHSLGAVRRIQAMWSDFIEPEQLVRSAATSFHNQLKALREQPDPPDTTVAIGAEVELTGSGTALPSIEEMMRKIRENGSARKVLIDQLLNAPLQRYDATVVLRTSQDQAIFLDQILGGVPDRPGSLAEVRARIRRLRGIIAHLEQAHRAADEERQVVCEQFERRRREAIRDLKRFGTFSHQMEKIFYTPKRVLQRIQTLLTAILEAHQRYSESHARAKVLSSALDQVRAELASYQTQWLGRLEDRLKEAIGRYQLSLDIVRFPPLEEVYPMLLDAALRAGQEDASESSPWKSVLMSVRSQVTFEGLGQMLRTDGDPQAIVSALIAEKFAWKSPLWGGVISYVEPRHRFIVLPPMAAGDLAELERIAKERGFAATLATTETIAAGCCVVSLSFYPVTKLDEALPPIYTWTTPTQSLNGKVTVHSQILEAVA